MDMVKRIRKLMTELMTTGDTDQKGAMNMVKKVMSKRKDILTPAGNVLTTQKTKRGTTIVKKRNDPKTYKTRLKAGK